MLWKQSYKKLLIRFDSALLHVRWFLRTIITVHGNNKVFLFFNEKYGVYLINVNKIDYIGQRQSSKKINIFENSQKVWRSVFQYEEAGNK